MKTKKKNGPLARIDLSLFLVSGLILIGCGKKELPNPSGMIEATEVEIAATMAGRVLEVRPSLGGSVQKGDTLIVVDTELISLQRGQIEAGLSSVAAQRSLLRENIAQADRNLKYLELQKDRMAQLVEMGSAPRQQLDELNAKRDVAAIQADAARRQLAALDPEEEKLNAALRLIDRQLSDGVILAPIDGQILLRSIEPGEFITPGKILLKLADMNHLELRIFLGSPDLARVKPGQSVNIHIDAIPDQTIHGTVTWISPEAEFTPKNAQTRDARVQLVYAVKISLANPEGRLHIGMPAEVTF